jgi:hypothetical protein
MRRPILDRRNQLLLYNSEFCPPACRGLLRWLFEGDSRNVVLAPDRFADVNSLEIVEAKIERVRQLISFESKLDAKAETRQIVDGAMVHGLILNQDLSGVIRLGALYSSVFHLMVHSLRSELPQPGSNSPAPFQYYLR